MKTFRNFSLPTIALFFAGAMMMDFASDWFKTTWTGVPSLQHSGFVESVNFDKSNIPDKVSLAYIDKHTTIEEDYTPEMWTKNKKLFKGETLQLHFKAPHAQYLGLVDPEGSFFYLVYPVETVVGDLMPLVESKTFVNLQSLYINTASLRADPYQYGVYINQPVFTQTGTYTFILGDNLHVDDPELLISVVVRYIHALRPAVVQSDAVMN